MSIAIDEVTAEVDRAEAPQAKARPTAREPMPEEERRRLDDLLQRREHRMSRLHAD